MSNSGGTLTLPSPTHVHHVDVQAGLRSLRRSLSRSPSKFSLVRTASQSSSSAGSSPSSPSCRRVQSQYFGHQPNSPAPTSFHGQSPLATPFRPSVKLSLRSAKKSPGISSSKPLRHRTSPRTSPRGSPRTSPRSPAPPRRALHATSNIANSTTPTSTPPDHNASGQENLNIFGSRSPTARKAAEKPSNRHSMHLDISGASSQLSMSRAADANTPITVNSLASPLKRSDANMNLDQTLSGSPRAKRRSFGPSNFGSEFNIFDQSPGSPDSDIQDDASREYDWTGPGIELASSPTPSVMPRRAGSLRRSTLQQRHTSERTSWGRRQGSQQLSQISHDATTTPNAKNRPRLSLDHFLPPPQRDSPFSQGGPLPNPSAHMIPQPAHQPHPLSRAMTTSSSNSSMVDDSPTHHPVQISEKPRAPMNWSKSLPLGALRPQPDRETGPTASVSTPDYKHARPFEGAFASTGLVSKMNRNPEAAPPAQRGFGFVPDTPCKKISGFNTYPPPPGSGGSGRRRRHIRHSFGTPSTPFNPPSVRAEDTFAEQSRPVLFNGFATRHSRKGSLLSLHSEDGRSPQTSEESVDSMIGIDEGIPPTPTKTQLIDDGFGQLTNDSPTTNRHMPVASPAFTNSLNSQRGPATNCKLSPPEGPYSDGGSRDPGDAICDDGDPDVPTVITGGTPPSISISMPASSQDRAKRGCMSTPAPLKTTCATPSIMTTTKIRFAKTDSALPASPLDRLEFADGASPHTPQDNVMPPDASRLSISNQAETSLFPFSGERKATFPPATPTTRPDTFSFFQDRRAITPVNGMAPRDLDETLVSRFGKVEYVGKGEFSQVYKVTELAKPAMKAQQSFFSTPTHRTPPSPSGKCFAVKKLSLPFQGDKDRAFRLREVSIMRSLQGCDHVLQLIDSWEHKNSLYIQTEYCEEGSLDVFLSLVGTKGRLDDFRIWKTMLEVTQVMPHNPLLTGNKSNILPGSATYP